MFKRGHARRGLTSKVTGDHGAGEAPPMGVRVDRWVRPRLAHQPDSRGMFCAMRHSTPLGSKSVKSRMAHGLFSGFANLHTKTITNSAGAYVLMPVVDILHQQMHLEVARVDGLIEGLQQEARFAVANVGKVFRGPRDLEAEREIELLRLLEVARRYESLDFNSGEIHDARFRGLTSKVTGDHGAAEGPPVGVRVDREVRHMLQEAMTPAGMRIANTMIVRHPLLNPDRAAATGCTRTDVAEYAPAEERDDRPFCAGTPTGSGVSGEGC